MYDNKRLFLVFEYLELDLKKYMDTTPALAQNRHLIKARLFFLQSISQGALALEANGISQGFYDKLPLQKAAQTELDISAVVHLPDAVWHSLLPCTSVSSSGLCTSPTTAFIGIFDRL